MTDRRFDVLIIGIGALANLFAARFVLAGASVSMLGTWPEGITAINGRGIRLVDSEGGEQFIPVTATDNPAECAGARFALVLVKAWQTERAARQLAQCLADDGIALSLQNGLGNREALIDALGAGRVELGSTTAGATLLGPGHVRPGGEGVISLGANPALGPLIQFFEQANFPTQIVPDVDALIWGKLAVNAAINPLTALLGASNGELLNRPEARQLMFAAAREVAAVAAARGVALPFDDPAAVAEDVARRTAQNRSSMLQDVARGAPTEIDAICGAVVRAGEKFGIPTPVNHTLWLLVKALIGDGRPMAEKPDHRGTESMEFPQ
ncbi:MAG: 2-dehydropantoate 2-reductase [Anaerolineae bacterium]|nr:2-dehydropantoate 2-reductase [Anaerolineae bacterium]